MWRPTGRRRKSSFRCQSPESSVASISSIPMKNFCHSPSVALVIGLWMAVGSSAFAAEPSLIVQHAQVTSILGAISAKRIDANIRKLVGFGTRHTMSETASDTRGIGAARRWIQKEMEVCAGKSGGRMQVTLDETTEPAGNRLSRPTQLVNVVATLRGTAKTERIYVVSGHYDSRASDVMDATSDAPGANDDASGTAAVMEMACAFAPYSFDATLVFMAVAAEEQGLLGATHWAQEAVKAGKPVAGMITNDIIGSPVGSDGQRDDKRVRLFADGLSPLLRMVINASKNRPESLALAESAQASLAQITASGGEEDTPTHALGRYLKEMGALYMPDVTVQLIQRKDRFLRGGDHLPFLERGFAAVRFTEPFENFNHQHQDVRIQDGIQYGDLAQFVDMDYIARVTQLNAAGLASLALAPAPPTEVGIDVSQLTHDTRLRWRGSDVENTAGYRLVWRETGSQVWQFHRDVASVDDFTLGGISKDNFVFGVQAVGKNGAASVAVYPRPFR